MDMILDGYQNLKKKIIQPAESYLSLIYDEKEVDDLVADSGTHRDQEGKGQPDSPRLNLEHFNNFDRDLEF